ncbi:MAG: hypothetical protein AAF581_11555 [Planctomycetota bacterium]
MVTRASGLKGTDVRRGRGSMNLPYMKLYPRDLVEDIGFCSLDFDARGFYLTLLCVAWTRLERPGIFVDGSGLPLDEVGIKQLLGVDVRKARRLLRELVAAGCLRIQRIALLAEIDEDAIASLAEIEIDVARERIVELVNRCVEPTSARHLGDISGTSPGHLGEVSGKFSGSLLRVGECFVQKRQLQEWLEVASKSGKARKAGRLRHGAEECDEPERVSERREGSSSERSAITDDRLQTTEGETSSSSEDEAEVIREAKEVLREKPASLAAWWNHSVCRVWPGSLKCSLGEMPSKDAQGFSECARAYQREAGDRRDYYEDIVEACRSSADWVRRENRRPGWLCTWRNSRKLLESWRQRNAEPEKPVEWMTASEKEKYLAARA